MMNMRMALLALLLADLIALQVTDSMPLKVAANFGIVLMATLLYVEGEDGA